VGLRLPDHRGFLTRGMLEADLAGVLRIERESFGIPWTERMFLAELRHEMSWARVLVDPHGDIGGYVVARFHGDLWHIMDIAVREDLRGRGLAAALLDELIAVTEATRPEYTLEVRPSNEQALTLYRSRGFEAVGRRPGYYHDNNEDAIVMVRKPGPAPDTAQADGAGVGAAAATGDAQAEAARTNSRIAER
jgi:[ribosomal protein S18]-alanine N-acetyltransferase